MSLVDRVIKGSASMLALRFYSMGLMLVLNGLLARWMGPDEFGSYLAGMNLLILISILGMAGLNQSMLRIISGRKHTALSSAALMRRCWSVAIGFSLLVTAIAAVLLYTFVGEWLGIPSEIILSILACSLLVSAHKLIATALRSVHAIATSSVLEGRSGGPLANTAYLPIAALLALGGLTAQEGFWGFAIALVLTIPLAFWFLKRSVAAADAKIDPSDETAAQGVETDNIFLFSLPFLLTQLLLYFSTEFDVLIAKAYTDEAQTAVFGGTRRLILQVMAPMQILTVSVGSSIAELYAKNDRVNLQRMLQYSSASACVVTLPILLLCCLFAPQILELVYGDPLYRDGAWVLIIMSIGQAVNCLTGQCGNLLILSGRNNQVLVIRVVFSIIMIAVGVFAVREYGIYGLAIATAAVTSLQNLIMWIVARVLVGYWTHPGLVLKKPKVRKTNSARSKSSGENAGDGDA